MTLPRFRTQPGHYEITLIASGHRQLEGEQVLGSGIVAPSRRRAPQPSARPSARASRPSKRRRPGRRPRPGRGRKSRRPRGSRRRRDCRLGVELPSPRRGHRRGHPGPRSAAARGDDRALATGPGCIKPERAKAPQRTTTTTSHCRQRGYADALVSTSVDVYAHSRAVKAARAASSAPRGTAHAERDHKSGGAFSSARIAGQEAGWCIMMASTELMHDLEASRTPKRAAPRNFPKVSQAGRSASFPLQIAQRCDPTRKPTQSKVVPCRAMAAGVFEAK